MSDSVPDYNTNRTLEPKAIRVTVYLSSN